MKAILAIILFCHHGEGIASFKLCFEIFEMFSFDFNESFLKLLFLSGILESVCLKFINDLLKTKALKTLMWKFGSFAMLGYAC